MSTYLILQNPGHNRVYYLESTNLALAELEIAAKKFDSNVTNIKSITVGNLYYVSFQTAEHLSNNDLIIVSKLSFIFALFEQIGEAESPLLKPIELHNSVYVDPKISNLLKYSGKTNEIFTKMMINIAILSSSFSYEQNIKLLDPVAGKGTTLFEATVYGFDVAGIEIHKNSVHEACVFFKKYLEREKYKHTHNKIKASRKKNSEFSDYQEFEYSATKAEFKDSSKRKHLTYVAGDTTNLNKVFKKDSFHLIVGDLPYGIAHGNVQKDKKLAPSRNPLILLKNSLPEWYKVIKKKGVIVLSWNKFVLNKEDIAKVLIDAGFELFTDEVYEQFEHKVDMSIKRDIIVARK